MYQWFNYGIYFIVRQGQLNDINRDRKMNCILTP